MPSNDTGTDELKRDIDRLLFGQAEIILRMERENPALQPSRNDIAEKYRQLRVDYEVRFDEQDNSDFRGIIDLDQR